MLVYASQVIKCFGVISILIMEPAQSHVINAIETFKLNTGFITVKNVRQIIARNAEPTE